MKRLGYIVAFGAMLASAAPAQVSAGDVVSNSPWMVAQEVEVVGHSPRSSLRLFEQGSIDALGFRPVGGDVYCFSLEFWMADGRRIYVQNRTFRDGDVSEFEFSGTNRTVDRIEYSCHPRFGVTGLSMEVLVR